MRLKILWILFLLNGCSVRDRGPNVPIDFSFLADPEVRAEPRSRYGNPGSYSINGRTYYVMNSSRGYIERGYASWYGKKFHGKLTSNREPYNMYALTAAHKTLPLPTWVKVTNLENGRHVIVRINDRGPFASGRIIDLSYAAASKLGMTESGIARVEVRALEPEVSNSVTSMDVDRNSRLVARERIYLQVGSFSNRENAIKLKQRLESEKFQQIHVKNTTISRRSHFRVHIGPLQTVNEAEELVSRLRRIGIAETRIVVE
jgi:rare lipoprotein A